MIVILLSWTYIFFTSISFGVFFSKRLKIDSAELIFTIILGLFTITLFASIWAFWLPISIEFNATLLVAAVLLGYNSKAELQSLIRQTISQIKLFDKTIKWLLLFFSILIVAICSTRPYIIDNETYYIQTIKWLNEFGFVKGLGNLDLFFGQTSGWHITQSVYNLSFLYDSFNDINGFLFLFFNLFVFTSLQNHLHTRNKTALLFGLVPLSYLFLFQFISAPSPDLAIYILSFLLFYYFIATAQTDTTRSLVKMALITFFACYIKITAAILLVLPLYYFTKNYKSINKDITPLISIGISTFIIFVLKNLTLTGYPLFPFQISPFPNLNYRIPTEIMDFFFSRDMMNDFYIPYNPAKHITLVFRLKQYFLGNGIDSLIGLATVLTLVVSPYFIHKSSQKKQLWPIYFCFLLLLTLLYYSSPQYRFYVYFSLFFGLLGLAHYLKKRKIILLLHSLNAILIAFLLCVPTAFNCSSKKNIFSENGIFKLKNLVVPEPNTIKQLQFKGNSCGNLKFNTPIETQFWINSNGNLPAVNEEQLIYFETNFHYMPQQRSHNLGDGFFAQKVTIHD